MKAVIYRYSKKFFLTAKLTRQIERRIRILYPADKNDVINRTGKILIGLYAAGILAVAGLFLFADFSLYYCMVAGMVLYAIVNTKVYGDLDRLELRLLKQLEKFVADVKFRFQYDGMIEDALQDAIRAADYEMAVQGDRMLEALRAECGGEGADYTETAPDSFFLTFYSICLMVIRYGDRKVEGQSVFIRNLGYLKEEINIEQLKRRRIENEFMGLSGLTLLPVFAVKPIEKWAITQMPELKSAYEGLMGMGTTAAVVIFTIVIYRLISGLKRSYPTEPYSDWYLEKLLQYEFVQSILLRLILLRRKKAEEIYRLLRETGYMENLTGFYGLRLKDAFIGGGFFAMLVWSMGIRLFLPAAFVGGIAGYMLPYVRLLLKKQMLILEREEEIVRFQTMILMLMHIQNVTIKEILDCLEQFAVSFRTRIYELNNLWSYKGYDTFREAREKEDFPPYRKLLDGLIACDSMPMEQAFEDAETDRAYYVEKHKQENEDLIMKKALIAKTIAFLPLCAVIIIKLIMPFVMQGIAGLRSGMMF